MLALTVPLALILLEVNEVKLPVDGVVDPIVVLFIEPPLIVALPVDIPLPLNDPVKLVAMITPVEFIALAENTVPIITPLLALSA